MQWLEAMWSREGKGIAKDAPKRHGLALFGEIITRELSELVKLNLLFLASALPLITLPAAIFATASICRMMVEDRNIYLLRDYLEAMRAHALRATIWSLASGLALWICGQAILTYGAKSHENLIYVVPLAVSLLATGFVGLSSAHFIVLSVMSRRKALELLKLSALATLVRPLPSLAALGFAAGLWLLHVLFYPISVFMPVTINISLGLFALSFAADKGARMVLGDIDKNATESAGGAFL